MKYINQRTGREDGRCGILPHKWIDGPCPITHKQRRAYSVHKAQASFRKEGYNLTFEEYKKIWDAFIPFTKTPYWEKKGRKRGDYRLERVDNLKAWKVDNLTMRKLVGRKKKGE